jgi:hypothetical protein
VVVQTIHPAPRTSPWNPHRLRLAQLVIEGLGEEGLVPYRCGECLALHVGAISGKREHQPSTISRGTADALRLLHLEINFVLAQQWARGS